MYHYQLFGLNIASDLELNAISANFYTPDVTFRLGPCPAFTDTPKYDYEDFKLSTNQMFMHIDDVADFFAHDGNEIIVDMTPGVSEEVVRMYLMGSGMGAILFQRGIIPIHGSCVCKDGKAMIITGDSGAGKSTMAARFLREGWKLLTDDVTPLVFKDGIYYAQSTYPGQKLWQDCIDRNDAEERVVGNIIREDDGREKYQLNAGRYFVYDTIPIRAAVMLTRGTDKLYLKEVTGFAKTDLLMRNVYRRFYVIDKEGQTELLRTCFGLGKQIKALLAERPDGENTEDQIYEYILKQLEE